ncbi:hypothetical protein ABH922_004561 [Rhodococcus sp. 27YEA15]
MSHNVLWPKAFLLPPTATAQRRMHTDTSWSRLNRADPSLADAEGLPIRNQPPSASFCGFGTRVRLERSAIFAVLSRGRKRSFAERRHSTSAPAQALYASSTYINYPLVQYISVNLAHLQTLFAIVRSAASDDCAPAAHIAPASTAVRCGREPPKNPSSASPAIRTVRDTRFVPVNAVRSADSDRATP